MLAFALATSGACSSGSDTSPSGSTSAGSGAEGGADSSSGGSTGGDSGDTPATTVRFSQAIDGAMLASRSVYQQIPVQLLLDGSAETVNLALGDEQIAATDEDGDHVWTVVLPLANRSSGTLSLSAHATTAIGEISTTAELVLVDGGQQMSDFPTTGATTTPKTHRVAEQLWLSFTDRKDTTAKAWLQRIDGAGRTIGDRVPLLSAAEDTLHARVAIGNGRVGVLFQSPGSPYANHFTVVDMQGKTLVDPIPLDGQLFGSFGGDVQADGDSFVFTWRRHDGKGASEVLWGRVDGNTGDFTGPVVVASSGPGTTAEPASYFDPFTVLNIAVVADRSIVSFIRNHYTSSIDLDVPKSFLATVDATGTITALHRAGGSSDFFFHWEMRSFALAEGVLSVYAAQDLLHPDDPPPMGFFGKLSDPSGSFANDTGPGTLMLEAPHDRSSFEVIDHPTHGMVMAWVDHRLHLLDPENARIELYTAPVAANLKVGPSPLIFKHAWVSANMSDVESIAAGSNVLLTWRDARHHGYLKLELWLDTVWYD